MKIDVFCPESRVELTAKPITKNIEMVPLLKENSEPVKVDNLPPRLSVYRYVAPRIVFSQNYVTYSVIQMGKYVKVSHVF